MKLKFLGGSQTVTGSKYLLEIEDRRYLIDCGLFQGRKELRLKNWESLEIDPSTIEAVILTHAHIDHSGYIPRLIKDGFKGNIYCTHATHELCSILLPDSGFLQEEESAFANKKGFSKHKPALPLFTQKEAVRSLSFFQSVNFEEKIELHEGITLTFSRAGHILGASHAIINMRGKIITFSGDIGRKNDPLMLDPIAPNSTDYLVIESTYGDRMHEDISAVDILEKVCLETIQRGGIILIPAFAVGRAQLIIYYLSRLKVKGLLPGVPIYLDSPMASKVTGLYERYENEHKLPLEECSRVCQTATHTRSVDESRRLCLDPTPKIIISASGMATGGRVIHHLKKLAPSSKNTILFVGFQAPATRGEKIINGAESIKIHGQYVPIKAEVKSLDFLSAHADANELIEWIQTIKKRPAKIFITHGEIKSSLALKDRIEDELKIECSIPEQLSEFEL